MTKKGKLIAVYGAENIETGVLTEGIAKHLNNLGIKTECLKWSLSSLPGDYRQDGTWIIAEGYTGTTLALGMVGGRQIEELFPKVRDFREPNLSLLIDGNGSGVQKREREAYRVLAEWEGWRVINEGQGEEVLREAIFAMRKEAVLVEGGIRVDWRPGMGKERIV